MGVVETNLGEVQRSGSRPPWKVDVCMHVVYICISVLTILPFITITTKFLSKHCIKRVLDTEMNGYHCFNFTEKPCVE